MRKKFLSCLIVTHPGLLSTDLPRIALMQCAQCVFFLYPKVGYEGGSDHNQAVKNK